MSSERFARAKEIVLGALERLEPDRARYLDHECRGDQELRSEVADLLSEEPSTLPLLQTGAAFARLRGPDAAIACAYQPTLRSGAALLHYRLIRELGQGGMGVVWRAKDTRLGRDVALKFLVEDRAEDPIRSARFEREARLLASLQHANIATLYSFEQTDERRFLVMEVVEGDDLASLVERGPMTVGQGVAIGRQLARALDAAHARGIVHRDLKPANVMMARDGSVKVLDFGVAKMISRARSCSPGRRDLTIPGTVVGTPGYMSPEQLRGESEDHRVDLWALGCILYECLSGRPAFGGVTPSDRITASIELEPDWSALPDDVPPGLREVITRCLCKNLDERVPNAASLRRRLEESDLRASAIGVATESARVAAVTGELAPRRNVPVRLTGFVGRDRERAELVHLLEEHRLTTVTGVGGSGKSRLLAEVASDATATPRDTCFVELAALTDPRLLPQIVATAVGLRAEQDSPIHALTRHYRDDRALLVLDNCEHLIDACSSLATQLLSCCAGLHLACTTREVLGIEGENVFHLSPMEIPDDTSVDPGTIEDIESVRLFVERARAVRPSFKLTAASAPVVAEICRRLDGIPLALELAAARIRVLSLEDIASRLEDRFQLLGRTRRGGTDRHRTLRAVVDWSYRQLDESERTLFRFLSVFAGSWTMEAAEAVAAGDAIERGEVLDLLTQLIDKSLVEPVIEVRRGIERTRYKMLETLRQYAHEQLDASGEAGTAVARHTSYFLEFMEDIEPLLRRGEAELLDRVEAEIDNIRTALRRTTTETALALAGTMWRFWLLRRFWDEGRTLCAELLARPDAREYEGACGKLLHAQGTLAFQTDYVEAEALLGEAVKVRRAAGDPSGVAESLNNLGRLALAKGDAAGAQRSFVEALELHRESGNRAGVARSLINLGGIVADSGDRERARSYFEESRKVLEEIGDRNGLAAVLIDLGELERQGGALGKARDRVERALDIYRELDMEFQIPWALSKLGELELLAGDLESARARYAASLSTHLDLARCDRAQMTHVAEALVGVARLLCARGNPTAASEIVAWLEARRKGGRIPASVCKAVEDVAGVVRSDLGVAVWTEATRSGDELELEDVVEHAHAGVTSG